MPDHLRGHAESCVLHAYARDYAMQFPTCPVVIIARVGVRIIIALLCPFLTDPMTPETPTSTTEFISIKDAALRYQKAEITIRRFVRSVLAKEKSTERTLVHPLPQDVHKLRKQNRPFTYQIAADLLEKHYGVQAAEPAHSAKRPDAYMHLLERTNTNLEEQLKVKDEQIRVLAQAIDDLSERQRETNILMKGLQERLLLPSPAEEVVDAESRLSKTKQKKSPKKKRGWWKLW